EGGRFLAEQDADFAALDDRVVADQVVGVAMPDRDARLARLEDRVVLGQAEPHTPAEEDADLVALGAVRADDRPLRARAGVESEPLVVVTVAVLDQDVVADLPTDPIAVVIPRDDFADLHIIAILEPDAAGVVAVEEVVVGPVAVEGKVLDDDPGEVL